MPLPEHFYTFAGFEVSLDRLCSLEPEWAANRIRELTKEVDELKFRKQADPAGIICTECGHIIDYSGGSNGCPCMAHRR